MEIDLSKKGKLSLSGFHHDLEHTIRKNGILNFENLIAKETGCYAADLTMDGLRIPGKTFFPADWSRKEVIDKIHEAYRNAIKNGIPKLENDGKYRLRGYTSEGIKIEMHITQNGHMKTAYPIFE